MVAAIAGAIEKNIEYNFIYRTAQLPEISTINEKSKKLCSLISGM